MPSFMPLRPPPSHPPPHPPPTLSVPPSSVLQPPCIIPDTHSRTVVGVPRLPEMEDEKRDQSEGRGRERSDGGPRGDSSRRATAATATAGSAGRGRSPYKMKQSWEMRIEQQTEILDESSSGWGLPCVYRDSFPADADVFPCLALFYGAVCCSPLQLCQPIFGFETRPYPFVVYCA